MIGGDVKALYPSLDMLTTSVLAGKAVKDSSIEYNVIDYVRLSIYLTIVLGPTLLIRHGLTDAVARRKTDSKAKSLACKSNKDMSGWTVSSTILQDEIKRKMLGLFVQTLTLILMSSHCYSFGGRIYLQKEGAGIGLRASACLARIIMCSWDVQWARMQMECGLLSLIFIRYVDNLRLYVFPLNKGWH